jgi:Glucokinase
VLTNCSWVIDAQDFYDGFRVKARIVNDFEAAAYSLPFLGSADLAKIGGGEDGWGQSFDWATLAVAWLVACAIGLAIYFQQTTRLPDSLTTHGTLDGACTDRFKDFWRD